VYTGTARLLFAAANLRLQDFQKADEGFVGVNGDINTNLGYGPGAGKTLRANKTLAIRMRKLETDPAMADDGRQALLAARRGVRECGENVTLVVPENFGFLCYSRRNVLLRLFVDVQILFMGRTCVTYGTYAMGGDLRNGPHLCDLQMCYGPPGPLWKRCGSAMGRHRHVRCPVRREGVAAAAGEGLAAAAGLF